MEISGYNSSDLAKVVSRLFGVSFSSEVAMSKVADVKLGWSPSVSADVVSQIVHFTVGGNPREVTLTREVSELLIEVDASTGVQFYVVSIDSEGQESSSEVYTFVLGDLQPPVPATGLFHEVVAVRDVVVE